MIDQIQRFDFVAKLVLGLILLCLAAAPARALDVSGSGLTASGNFAGPFAPSSTTLTVSAISAVPENFTATANQPWVTLTPSSGTVSAGFPQDVVVSINASANALLPGTHTARVEITDGAVLAGFRDVTLTVLGPSLSVTPVAGLSSSGLEGGPFSPSTTSYDVENIGNQPLAVTIAVDQPWVTLSETSGTWGSGASISGTLGATKGNAINVTINAAANALAAGTHTATVTFTNGGNGVGNTTRTVTLTIARPGTLSVSNTTFNSAGEPGGPFTPSSRTYTLTNTGTTSIQVQITKSETWISSSFSGVDLSPGASSDIIGSLGPGANGLPTGTHTAEFGFVNTTNGRGSTTRQVSLVITRSGTLEVSSGEPVFRGPTGGPFDPVSFTTTLSNVGQTTLNWTAANTGSTALLTFNPASGTLTAGQSRTVTITPSAAAAMLGSSPNPIFQPYAFTNSTNGKGNATRQARFFVLPTCRDGFDNGNVPLITPRPAIAFPFDTTNATGESGEPDHGGISAPLNSIWCQLTSPFSIGEVTVDTLGTAFNTTLGIYSGLPMAGGTLIAFNDNVAPGVGASRLTTSSGGFLFVDGRGAAKGRGLLNARLNRAPGSTPLVSAVLPNARSAVLGQPVTAFGTLINSGTTAATGCRLELPIGFPADFSYQTVNASNQPIGTPNTPVNVPGGGVQSFVFSITPTQPVGGADVIIVFRCGTGNGDWAEPVPGVNSLGLSAASIATPDMIAVGATPTQDGILNIPGNTGVAAFAAATVNIGAAGTITASVDDSGRSLPISTSICQTNPSTGACINPPTPGAGATFASANNQITTVAVFVTGAGNVPFLPGDNRLFVRFRTPDGVIRGATSVAVRTATP